MFCLPSTIILHLLRLFLFCFFNADGYLLTVVKLFLRRWIAVKVANVGATSGVLPTNANEGKAL